MNKKKFTSIAIIICIIMSSVIAIYAKELATESINNIYADLSSDEEKIIKRINKDTPLKDKLKAKGHYIDYIETSIDKYVESSVMYEMTDDENQYIMSLFEKGYDFEKLIDIYTFLKNTSTNISATEKIYEIGKDNFDSPTWLENAYDVYIGDGRFEVTTEEIFNYVDEGITPQEIMRCYEICLALNRPLKEILDERVSQKSWDEIFFADSVQVCSTVNSSLDSVASIVKVAHNLKRNPQEIMENKDGEINIKENFQKKYIDKKAKVKELKNNTNILPYDDKSILEEAKKYVKGFDENQIKKMLDEGYRIKDIKAASENISSHKSNEIRHKFAGEGRNNK